MKAIVLILMLAISASAQTNTNALDLAKQKQADARKQQQEYAAAVARAQARNRLVESSKMTIQGKVIQKLKGGVLVESGSLAKAEAQELTRQLDSGKHDPNFQFTKTQFPLYYGWVFLTDANKEGALVDGDKIQVNAYPNGSYEYTAVSGAKKSVRKFTCSNTNVNEVPTSAEIRLLQTRKTHNINESLAP